MLPQKKSCFGNVVYSLAINSAYKSSASVSQGASSPQEPYGEQVGAHLRNLRQAWKFGGQAKTEQKIKEKHFLFHSATILFIKQIKT